MYSRFLVPLDGSSTSFLALDHAAELARLSGATVILLHVVEPTRHSTGFERPEVYIKDVRPRFLEAGQALLDEAASRLRPVCRRGTRRHRPAHPTARAV